METTAHTIHGTLAEIKNDLARLEWEREMLERQAKPFNDRLAEIQEEQGRLTQRLAKVSHLL